MLLRDRRRLVIQAIKKKDKNHNDFHPSFCYFNDF